MVVFLVIFFLHVTLSIQGTRVSCNHAAWWPLVLVFDKRWASGGVAELSLYE